MYNRYIKRILDFIIAFILFLLLSPLMLLLIIIIKKDGGPAIFKQKRNGKNGSIFTLYKFRSMTTSNNVYNLKKEDEITKIGKWLRNTSLDELPQLVNILKGEMSFIGPRPWITDYSRYFTDHQMRRLEVLPGITGLAQCSGRNNISVIEKINLDIYYVEHRSFKIDFYIVLKSILTVIKKEGTISSKFSIQNELEELEQQTTNDIRTGIFV